MKDYGGTHLTCTKCGKKKRIEAFARDDDRRHSRCKECSRRQTPRATLLIENRALEAKGERRCSACYETRALDLFPLFPSGRRSGSCRPCRLEEKKQLRVAKGGMTREQRRMLVAEKKRQRELDRRMRGPRGRTSNGESAARGNGLASKEYISWRAMMKRCYYPKHHNYHRYGGRGVKVCEQWQGVYGFVTFVRDVGRAPTPKHTIDRIDPFGNYEPGNCRWADAKTQTNNTRRSTRLRKK